MNPSFQQVCSVWSIAMAVKINCSAFLEVCSPQVFNESTTACEQCYRSQHFTYFLQAFRKGFLQAWFWNRVEIVKKPGATSFSRNQEAKIPPNQCNPISEHLEMSPIVHNQSYTTRLHKINISVCCSTFHSSRKKKWLNWLTLKAREWLIPWRRWKVALWSIELL